MNRTLLALAAAAVLVAGCGGQTDDPGTDPTGDLPTASEDAAGGAAGGTTMRVYTVAEVTSGGVANPIHVSGLLIDDGSGWKLCGAIAESYPPQCAGEMLNVDGVDDSEFALQEAGEVRWLEDATLVGEVHGDTLTVTGSATSS